VFCEMCVFFSRLERYSIQRVKEAECDKKAP
jgi:hypothetical protein